MKYKNNHLKIIEEDYESKFHDYRNIDEEELEKYINRELGDLPIHRFLQQLILNDLLWDFDAVSVYPNEMSDEKSIYPRIETGYVFTPDIKNDLLKNFNN